MGIELLTEEQYQELQKLGEFRHEVIELDKSAGGNQKTGRRDLWRPPLRPGLRLSQRRGVLLQRPGVSRFPEGLNWKPAAAGSLYPMSGSLKLGAPTSMCPQ